MFAIQRSRLSLLFPSSVNNFVISLVHVVIFFFSAGLTKRINETLPYIGMALDHPDRDARLSVAPAICKFSEHCN